MNTFYVFQSIAVKENAGVINKSSIDFLNALGHCISSASGEEHDRELFFLAHINYQAAFQCMTVSFEMLWTSTHSCCFSMGF